METLLSALGQKTSLTTARTRNAGETDFLVAKAKFSRKDIIMTREQVEDAAASGNPFTLLMADGKEYHVPHRDYIFFPPKATYVIVTEDSGRFHILPVRTMTGLTSNEPVT